MSLSDSEVVDLHCLKAVDRTGHAPDGCDVGEYADRGFLIRYGGRCVLTPVGTLHMKELAARGDADS
jgi:hypothetical protein